MSSGIHSKDPKSILGRALSAAFKKRGLSARSVAKSLNAAGINISNKTVSQILNGKGNPQLDNLVAVAKQAHVPLWQLLCPAIEISRVGDDKFHEVIEGVAGLSETSLAQVRRTIRAEKLLAKEDGEENSSAS